MRRAGTAILTLALLTAACGGDAEPENGNRLDLGALSHGSAFEVDVGDSVVVQLEGNPATGYSWIVRDVDPAVLLQAGDYEFLTNDEVIGGAGMMQYTFEAIAAGETVLQLTYQRPWETDVAPLDEWAVTITVR